MSKKWEEKRISLGSAIIAATITLVVGIIGGLLWQGFVDNFLPYLGVGVKKSTDWSALDEVYNTLSAHYDGELDRDVLIEGAKQGLVAAVGDIYTTYMPAETAEEFEAALHGEAGSGIGVEMGVREGYLRVLRTLPDNPARKAGIKAGDIIYQVDGEDIYNLTPDEASAKIRGEAGSSVEITVVRDGEQLTFNLVRETINNVSAYITYDTGTIGANNISSSSDSNSSSNSSNSSNSSSSSNSSNSSSPSTSGTPTQVNIAIITVTRFDTDTGSLVRQLITSQEFQDHKVGKIILDLRSNGGGYVSAAKDLLSLWLDGDAILIQKSRTANDETTYANRGQNLLADIPTVVLVNGSTASASEIVAGALQDYHKATILGETTFGKGVVQTLYNLSANTLLKVTTARWYTPSGTTINGEGIHPDVKVTLTYDDTNHNRDPQLDAAKTL